MARKADGLYPSSLDILPENPAKFPFDAFEFDSPTESAPKLTLLNPWRFQVETILAVDSDGLKLFEDSGTYGILVGDPGGHVDIVPNTSAVDYTLALDRRNGKPSIIGRNTTYGKTVIIDGYGTDPVGLQYYGGGQVSLCNSGNSLVTIDGGETITSAPTSCVTNRTGWKLMLYDNDYGFGVASYTLAAVTGKYLSLFLSSALPANDGDADLFDSKAKFTCGGSPDQINISQNFSICAYSASTTYLGHNATYMNGSWRRTYAQNECVLGAYFAIPGSPDKFGWGIWYNTDANSTRGSACAWDEIAQIYRENSIVHVALGGAVAASNIDTYVDFASDAYIYWNESESYVVFYVVSATPLILSASTVYLERNTIPYPTNTYYCGNSSYYWTDVSSKAFTDRSAIWIQDPDEAMALMRVIDNEEEDGFCAKAELRGQKRMRYSRWPRWAWDDALEEATEDIASDEVDEVDEVAFVAQNRKDIPRREQRELLARKGELTRYRVTAREGKKILSVAAEGFDLSAGISVLLGAVKGLVGRVDELNQKVAALEAANGLERRT